nr:YciI family protein [Actinopolyspora mzabensis]
MRRSLAVLVVCHYGALVERAGLVSERVSRSTAVGSNPRAEDAGRGAGNSRMKILLAWCRVRRVGDDPLVSRHKGGSLTEEETVKYLILMQVDPAVLEQLTDEQQRQLQEGHAAFIADTKERGEFIATQALADPSQSKVVRSSGSGPEVTDGPFVESKEFMGGFYLIDVVDEARAVELAEQIPDANIPGLALELRPVMFADLGDG